MALDDFTTARISRRNALKSGFGIAAAAQLAFIESAAFTPARASAATPQTLGTTAVRIARPRTRPGRAIRTVRAERRRTGSQGPACLDQTGAGGPLTHPLLSGAAANTGGAAETTHAPAGGEPSTCGRRRGGPPQRRCVVDRQRRRPSIRPSCRSPPYGRALGRPYRPRQPSSPASAPACRPRRGWRR